MLASGFKSAMAAGLLVLGLGLAAAGPASAATASQTANDMGIVIPAQVASGPDDDGWG
ncbi:hypothetical protein U9R90_33670 [Streptomyces sp. E11-3]|uniref:hypothetical protein n=1 Tax=Streptomyces sp. E11-3 TaxID=3110112 RepID=UPI00397FFBB5